MPALLKLAGNDSPLAGLKASEIEARDGGLGRSDEPACRESYVSILSRAGREEIVAEAARRRAARIAEILDAFLLGPVLRAAGE